MRREQRSIGETSYQVIAYAVVTIVALSAFIPLLYIVGMSFATQQEITETGGLLLFPRHPTITAYRYLFAGGSGKVAGGSLGLIGNALMISIIRTAAGTGLSILLIYIGAYALAQRGLPGRGGFILMVIVAMLVSGGTIPTYLWIRRLHMINTLWALILPGAIDGFSFLVIKSFIESLPRELSDSAEIDGAGEIRKMISLCAPLTAPAIAAIALFTSLGHWNAWFDALLYIDNQRLFPLQLFIRNIDIMMHYLLERAGMGSAIRVGSDALRMAAVFVAMAPILIAYSFLQKYFTKGMYMGAIKG
jgi:putative aldouronate transport system permease protein